MCLEMFRTRNATERRQEATSAAAHVIADWRSQRLHEPVQDWWLVAVQPVSSGDELIKLETKEEQDDIDNVTDESLKHLARVLAAEQDVARHPEHFRLDFFESRRSAEND